MYFLTDDYRLTSTKNCTDILNGLDATIYKCIGGYKRRSSIKKKLLEQAGRIQENSCKLRDMPTELLRTRIEEFKIIFRRKHSKFEQHLPDALSAIVEASSRTLGIRPYMVQIAGALALYNGYIAEMATGEGKTLTASLTAIIRGWSGIPCHVITVNDYLASRDAQKLEPLYSFCGVTVGCVTSTMQPHERSRGYQKDITYSTAKEITADFLRDRLALGSNQAFERRQIQILSGNLIDKDERVVTRGIHTAIIDEADSLLIDEAVTPLIISQKQPNESFEKACLAASELAARLKPDIHYTIDFQYKEIEILDTFDFHSETATAGIPKQFSGENFLYELLRQALVAKEFFHLDKQYVIQDDKIVIVDEFTGRTMAQRSWSEGLHQMVEAKEKLPITPPNETLARLSFQRFFRFYHNLSGMTGTAREASSEFWHIYQLPVIQIPPNKACQRKILSRKFFPDQESKHNAIIEEIISMHLLGRPVLVGTRSVKRSEEIAARLTEKGYHCKVINAVRHLQEAAVVAEAGKKGAITVATNMAGRGTDIILDKECEKAGGLHVIAAECNDSLRIDRQLYGRCARQGDNGSARSFVSLDDELLKRYLNPGILKILKKLIVTNSFLSNWLGNLAVKHAQNNAQKRAYSMRKSIQKTDTWLKDSLSFSRNEF